MVYRARRRPFFRSAANKELLVACELMSAARILMVLIGLVLSQAWAQEKSIRRPNILVCVSDDQSFPHAGAYGARWVNTPAFDRIASQAILFNKAYTPNAKCSPSRSALLTGRNPWQLGQAANHAPYFPAAFKSYAELLAQHGYATGYTGKGWAPGEPGTNPDGAPRELLGPAYNKAKLEAPTSAISPIDYAENFKTFLAQKDSAQPFCFWFGAKEPHRPFEYGSGKAKGKMLTAQIDSVFAYLPDIDSVRNDLLDYAYEINYFDTQLARIIALLEETGELNNTLIIVTSDNGMAFPRVKGNAYERSNHLPLAMMWPAGIQNPGRAYQELVSITDLAPTILDITGIDTLESAMAPFEGNSLLPVLAGSQDAHARGMMVIGKERHDVGRPHDWGYPIRGIISGDFLYIHNFEVSRWPSGNPETGYLDTDGSPSKSVILHERRYQGEDYYWNLSFGFRPQQELYNLAVDSDCMNNLAEDPRYSQLKTRLQESLKNELEAERDPRMAGQGALFDSYPYSGDHVRNFHKRFSQGEDVSAGWVNPDDFEKVQLGDSTRVAD